ncbi:Anaphase-promoting complex subunit 1-like [Homarus americanus]|uniref:Anaphase-promoting complex subunit 1-like n=1 Tax=Homarus americanus TaxID=6706 RepID=A0A8J5JHR6_HOMAM|nr:Anaphase-promoting complex subunit 1-like [Homarus americanus]
MISCGDAQEYVPFGREYLGYHPGDVGLPPPRPNPAPPHIDLLRQLDTVSINGSKDWWEIRHSTDGLTEEELYVCGPTVVWSRGQAGNAGSRQVIKCMTCDSSVQYVMFATFYTYPDQPPLLGEPVPEEPTGELLPSICVVESDSLNVFTEDGDDYSVALPFPVRKVWPVKYGILLERQVPSAEIASPKPEGERLPTFYSLLHPLDEINPLLYRAGYSGTARPAYMSDLSQQAVFMSTDPSICILYNSNNNSHTIWKIRRAKLEENNLVLQSSVQASLSNTPVSSVLSNPGSFAQLHSYSHSHSLSQSHSHVTSPAAQISSHSPTPTSSRTRSSIFPNMLTTPKTQHSQTPRNHMATLSRTQSPSLFGGQHLRLAMSPSPARSPGPRTPRTSQHTFLNETLVEPEPLVPDICLDHLWTDHSLARATKAFLTEDSVGQRYLCLMLSQAGMLRCIKYDYTNDQSSLVFGSVCSIPAKDALPIKALKMMIVVDGSSSLSLYTGSVHVSRINLCGLPTFNSSLFKDFSSLNISSRLQSPATTPLRRSSLLTSSRPTSAADAKFEIGLSPVVTERSHMDGSFSDDPNLPVSSAIVSLRDPTDTRVTLEHANGNFYRITLPDVTSSPVVKQSLAALKHVLPRDAALQLVNKWYATRNAPGSGDFSPQGEWTMFSMMLLSMIGYDTDKLALTCPVEASDSCSTLVATKKFRAAESGSDNDWEYMLSSSFHMAAGNSLSEVLGLQKVGVMQKPKEVNRGTVHTNAPLFSHFPSILFALHLVYEDFKLNTLHWEFCSLLVTCLDQLASDLRLNQYLHHYWRDFPTVCPLHGPPSQVPLQESQKLTYPGYFTENPPNVLAHLYTIMGSIEPEPFPFIPQVCTTTKNLILLYSVAAADCGLQNIPLERFLRHINPNNPKPFVSANLTLNFQFCCEAIPKIHEKIVLLTDQLGLTVRDIQLLSPGVSLVLMNAQHMCRTCPPQDWPASAYHLIHRPDLVAHREEAAKNESVSGKKSRDPFNIKVRMQEEKKVSQASKEEEDGMETLDMDMLALRWREDQRITEVQRMFCSSRAVTINIVQRPEVSDHDFLEEQERHLYALCIRTMSLPIGRGMFTLFTSAPVITETLPIPKLNLSGRAPPRGTTIDLSNIEVPPNMDMWPHFHNGVAAGLKIAPNCGEIDSTWIVYNKPKGSLDSPTEHAGFLMALGLNGHLRNLATVNMHDYLARGHEMTCVGLLLGISVAKRGTMDIQTTKLLSVHLECLLPPTSTELDVPHTVQVAAIIGVGLVYQDTAHRHMAEVLLQEIGRPPGPEMENSNDRESYSLAAGLALGLVLFGRGGEAAGFTDLNIAGELYHYIEGGHKKPLFGIHKDKYKSPSYQIKEGDCVNIDVTAPGATLALGMIYFQSNNKAIAEWMVSPSTPYLLDQVRPDFLLLRTVALGLIMWDAVMPTSHWIESHVPMTVLTHVHRGGNHSTPGIDYESMHQAYYNILAGACMVIGLKFAGSGNSEAFQILWKYTRMFTNFTKRSVAELAGKSTIETCLNVILLSLSMVMAGTGDLDVLRIIRYLRSRVGPSNSTVGYGSHLTIHMALGFLFLGGGRFSLGTSNMAIAALLIACFPKFPTHSNDNRYHLQALRHLYVLAAEPRLLMPVDVDTGRLCQVNVTVRFSAHNRTWSVLETILCSGEGLAVKLKDGRYPYGDAPSGFQVQLAHLLTQDKSARWTIKGSLLEEVSGCSARLVRTLVGGSSPVPSSSSTTSSSSPTSSSSKVSSTLSTAAPASSTRPDEGEAAFTQALVTIIYEYLSVGKPQAITNWLAALQGVRRVSVLSQRAGLLLWQVKLIARAAHFLHCLSRISTETSPSIEENNSGEPSPLVSAEQALSLNKRLELLTDTWLEGCSDPLSLLGILHKAKVPAVAISALAKILFQSCT